MDEETHNPLDDLISFPEQAIHIRQDILPSESNGWGIHLLLELPRLVVQASLDAQLTTAGFRRESVTGQASLLRFISEDAYVWAMVADAGSGRISVLLNYTSGKEAQNEP
jgi:hypothetical protein